MQENVGHLVFTQWALRYDLVVAYGKYLDAVISGANGSLTVGKSTRDDPCVILSYIHMCSVTGKLMRDLGALPGSILQWKPKWWRTDANDSIQ